MVLDPKNWTSWKNAKRMFNSTVVEPYKIFFKVHAKFKETVRASYSYFFIII